MKKYDLNNKKFKAINNSDNGNVGSDTTFHYRQVGNNIWATYAGGNIELGTLIGVMDGDNIKLIYQQLNPEGEFLTGYCDSTISTINGKIRLDEKWRWTCKDYSEGTSLLEEI